MSTQHVTRIIAARLRRVWLDRRRVAMVMALAFTAGVLFYLRYELTVYGMPLPLFTGLVYGVVVGLGTVATMLVIPAFQTFVEAVAVARLLVAGAAFALPGFGAMLVASPLLGAHLVIIGGFALRPLVRNPALTGWLTPVPATA